MEDARPFDMRPNAKSKFLCWDPKEKKTIPTLGLRVVMNEKVSWGDAAVRFLNKDSPTPTVGDRGTITKLIKNEKSVQVHWDIEDIDPTIESIEDLRASEVGLVSRRWVC